MQGGGGGGEGRRVRDGAGPGKPILGCLKKIGSLQSLLYIC